MERQKLIPHLFRTEFSKITSVLCKYLGIKHLQVAEDIASETFLLAMETWPYNKIPPNPVAWLYTVAKNKAINYITRNNLYSRKILPGLKENLDESNFEEIDLTEQNITDSQLQMLFALCHPALSVESQVALSLRVLCGFGIEEIANAFLTNKETINKRLTRGKEKLREVNFQIEMPASNEIHTRLSSVLTTLYLLFNEGYYSESNDDIIREELCLEAMRLMYLLIDNKQTNTPEVNALFSLMCFHASRFKARKNKKGEIILYEDQDEALWNYELIAKGVYYLKEASAGDKLSKYHLEAGIGYWHTVKSDSKEKWENILQLYNHLLQLEYSPIAALNRTFALSKVKSKEEAITEAEKLKQEKNPFYFTLLGELNSGINNLKALENFKKARLLATTNFDKQVIQKRIDLLTES